MKKIQALITLFLVVVTVSAGLVGTVSLAAPTETHGAISITFDDCRKDQYDYAFPLMQARGIIGTFYVVTDDIRDFSNDDRFLSIAELQTLQDYGCEIASHSKTHPTFTGISDSQIRQECSVSKQVLQYYGFSADNFAYPYGSRNNHTDSIVAEYYRSARSAYHGPYIMQFPVSQFVLPGFAGETGDSSVLPRLKSMVDEAYSTKCWVIIFFHQVLPGVYDNRFGISSQDFESFLDYIVYKGVPTITVNQGLDLTSPPSPPPSVTISPTSVKMYIGQSRTFSSSVTDGNPPFSYQWYLNDIAVPDATGSTWTFTLATTGHYKVYVEVTDGLNFEAQSNIVTDITVYPQLTVSISPVSVNMTVGASQTFSSTVSGGAPPYSYQWYLNGTAVSGAPSATWAFNASTIGTYIIYINVTDNYTATTQSTNATARVWAPATNLANLVVRGENNIIYYRTYNTTTTSWAGWNALPGATGESPAATVCGNELHLVVRGMDGNTLWHGYINLIGGGFSGWTLLSGSTPSAPTLTANSTHLCLVVRGQNNMIYYRFYTIAAGTWTDWAALPSGATVDGPAATMLGNKLHVVVRGMDGTLWHSNLDLSSAAFSGWTIVGGATQSKPTLTASASRNAVYLVVRGLNNVIYRNTWSGSSWAGWIDLPSGTTCDGAGAAVFGDKLNIVIRSFDENSLWQGAVDLATGTFTSWTMLSGSTPSPPTLTS